MKPPFLFLQRVRRDVEEKRLDEDGRQDGPGVYEHIKYVRKPYVLHIYCDYSGKYVQLPHDLHRFSALSSIKVQNTPFLPLRCSFCAFEGRNGSFLPPHWVVRWARNGREAPLRPTLMSTPTPTPATTRPRRQPPVPRPGPFVEKLVENRRICLEFSGFLCTFAVRKKGGVPAHRR